MQRFKDILSQFYGLFLIFSFTLFAAPTPPAETPSNVSLEEILKATSENNGMIQESLQDVEVARAQLEQAKAALYPKATLMVLAAPIFEETGDALQSKSNWSKWGPLLTGGVQIVQPLYTFGMISSYRRAAEGQIEAKTGIASSKKNDVIMQAKEMYFGYQMATDLEKLVDDLSSFLAEAVKTAEETAASKKKKSTVKPHDIFRLKTALNDLEQKKLYAKAAKQTAERAVAWLSGLKFANLEVPKLKPMPFEKLPMEDYLKMAKATRPEFKALVAGQQARLALRDAKQAQSYPILFVGAFGQAGWSPVRTKQQSVFANDPFNPLAGGVGVGLKFDLEFMRHSAEAQEQNAEAMKLKAMESWAAPGIELQVKKAYWELEQALDGFKIADARRATSKKWFVQSGMGWSIGITAAKDLLEALEGDGLSRKNYIETVYAVNMSIAKLSQAVGKELGGLKY